MRFSKSALLFLGTLAGSFFPPGVQAGTTYTQIGTGGCRDCSNDQFDYIHLGDKADTERCQNDCEACAVNESAEDKLLGFTYGDSLNFERCKCHFDDGASFNELCGDQGAGASDNYQSGINGSGEICSADGVAVSTCYSKVDAVPSDSPSESPSDVPSMKPSDVPSDVPSMKPSGVPSDLPSMKPSDQPSESPSDNPSSEPSGQPSLSRPPSDSPSTTPSQTPSDEPSTEPSSEPSSTPSCSPSASPTTNPSNEYGVNLWYPEWMNGDEGCRNDGEEPNYMSSNPNQWLSSTLEKCCKQWFGGYSYNNCMGNYPPGDCTVKLYYPDWQGSNNGCLNDGQEPYYMLANADHFLSNTLQECCDKFYLWNLYKCTGTTPTLSNGDYYPDWENASAGTCKNDGAFPEYMLANQGHYLSTTLEKCCKKFYHWDLNTCMGTSAVGSGEWYVDWTSYSCAQDCEGATPCGGLAESWDEKFSTLDKCCRAKLPWMSLSACRTASE